MPTPDPNAQTADQLTPPPEVALPSAHAPGEAIGSYTLVSLIGEGGFGEVWLAERREPILQRVAIKLVKAGMDSRAVLVRFEQERQALAVMDHPNIARVLDAGTTPKGHPYFVMEYVPGEAVTTYCDRHNLDLRARLELFIPVCEAVQHAHTKGIIHRDIKPSNILVQIVDGKPWPKVIDFGVAKAISHNLAGKREFTEFGQLIGTPEYMSPEQAEMGALDIDTRTDVYSLGVVLYELLVGVLPFDPKTLRSRGFGEIQRIIREVEPPRPSTRLSSLGDEARDVAARRNASPVVLGRILNRELEWIPLRAMRKDRTRRYGTPAELAEDVRNYLAGRLLRAGPESASYRLRKFVRRNRVSVTAGVLAFAGIAVGAVVATRYGIGEAKARRATESALAIADSRRQAADALADFLVHDILSTCASDSTGPETRLTDVLDRTAKVIPSRLVSQPQVRARMLEALGLAYRAIGRPDDAHVQLQNALAADPDGQFLTPATRQSLKLIDAEVLWRQGKTTDAITEIERVLTAVGSDPNLGGPDGSLALEARNQLANAYKLSGRLAEAEALYRAVITAQEKSRGIDDVETLTNRYNLALVGVQRGQAETNRAVELLRAGESARAEEAKVRAKAHWERALKDLQAITQQTERALGATDPQTLSCKSEVASLLNRLERYREGEPVYAEVLEAMRTRLGARHWRTAETTYNFARLLDKDGRTDRAVDLYRDALDAYRLSRGPAHPDTVSTANRLVDAWEKTGATTQAADLLARTYADLVEAKVESSRLERQAVRARDFFKRRGDEANVRLWAARCPADDAAK